MAKNTYDPTDLARRDAAIRKAKGNPNKNVHRKKNNSNYGGGDALAKKTAAREAQAAKSKQPPLPRGTKIALWSLIGALLAVVVLNYAVFRDNAVMQHVMLLLVGLLCCMLAYINYFVRKLRGIHTVLAAVLAVMGAVYALSSAAALLELLPK